MLANNICDIEDDLENRRYTLPIYIGKEAALKLFAWLYYIGFAAVDIAVALGALPLLSIIVLAAIVPIRKHKGLFNKVQTKKDTFVLSVKNFVLMNTALVLTIALGAIFSRLLS
jgi:1,4-dihydroxy-2-naphthoate octaprenyltransferase